ncbi:MAG: ERF family protein [Bacteroidales bacterium]|nr:ERF family protein [Bacteroidales bacterium]
MKELVDIQSKLKAPKGQYNSFGKYKYRSCEDILEAVKPLLKENNCTLTIADDIMLVGDRFYVKAIVTLKNSNGETVTTTAFAREEESKKGMDGSQVTGASSSYARKYALNGMFCIDDTKDSDTTNTGHSDENPLKEVAMADIESAKDMNALMAVWSNYQSLQKDKDFVSAMTNKKNKLKNNA